MWMKHTMTLDNWLTAELYWKITKYDLVWWIVTLCGFASKEASDEGKAPIEKKRYAHATEPEREEEIFEEVEVEDETPTAEASVDGENKKAKATAKQERKKERRKERRATGKKKKVKNEDYISKEGELVKKLYKFVMTKEEWKWAKKA